jgi:hypothetical protein
MLGFFTYPITASSGNMVVGCHRIGETIDVYCIVAHFGLIFSERIAAVVWIKKDARGRIEEKSGCRVSSLKGTTSCYPLL